jgi:hypothetical protein
MEEKENTSQTRVSLRQHGCRIENERLSGEQKLEYQKERKDLRGHDACPAGGLAPTYEWKRRSWFSRFNPYYHILFV